MNNSQPILYELKAGIACLTINRPEALNALSLDVLNQFSRLFDEIRTNESVKAVIITGSGKKAFSAGADIKYLSESSRSRSVILPNWQLQSLTRSRHWANRLWQRLMGTPLAEVSKFRKPA